MKWITIMALAALMISLGLVKYTMVQAERQMMYLQEALKQQDKAIEAALIRQGESLRQELAESLARATLASAGGPSQPIPVAPTYQQPRSQGMTVSEFSRYQEQLQEERERAFSWNSLESRMKELEKQSRQLQMCKDFGSAYC